MAGVYLFSRLLLYLASSYRNAFYYFNSFIWFCLHHFFIPANTRTGLIMGCCFHHRRWQEVQCSKQEVRVASAEAVLGHFRRTTSRKGNLMLRRGGVFKRISFLSCRVFRVHVSHRERQLKQGMACEFVSSPQSPLPLLPRSASFYFRLYVPLLLPGARSSFHLNMLLLVHRAALRSFTVPSYTLGFTALLQLLPSGLIVLQGRS